ncbi:hypothetical protein THAOC_17672 [Thalassiosira oceanica]|uniref:Aminotransferase class I/classII large domain-containing protein n=1 Tax=Thalassiosira oceanica TaxID=159749 RepID=K0SU73_THAOC|nr:hypothetical protein THAOC_17672 [Thalassiosira oceanica]|eukprot:EJK61782.1 hypothetical protein THAOC_17672 [Thalassiosira oceanica]
MATQKPGMLRSGRSRSNSAHNVFLEYHKHRPSVMKGMQGMQTVDEVEEEEREFDMFHHVMKTGVIYATSRALKNGFSMDDDEWANMGQGAPETGPLPGAPSRDFHYTYENVCVVPGGRAGLTRVMAALGDISVGFFTPDYTAYQQALGLFSRITPSVLLHRNVNEPLMASSDFRFEAGGRGLGAMLLSNPANPTGQSIEGDELESYVEIARDLGLALLMDEFYSHYYYDGETDDHDGKSWPKTVSSASFVEDVNEDPVVIVNGLTKNWRCPGFRVCWIVAPKSICEMLSSAGSFLDGGANAPLQKLALPLMEMEFIRQDTWALQKSFRGKRDFLLAELEKLGIKVNWVPTATFYVWADLSDLPPPLNDCLVFLEECCKHKVICVPGVFFDLNPRQVRHLKESKSINYVRFSYGPRMENLVKGVASMKKMIDYWRQNSTSAGNYAYANL